MPHRQHLFSLRIGHALRETAAEGYGIAELKRDLLAGVTVGIIAIPLAMALAIASGVPPQHGLYTCIIAGFLIALCGGSRLSISGPTAAFIVILYPVTQKYGLAGLSIATVLSGVLLIAMAMVRLGRFIAYIPEAVTLGFTAGIAVVIATLQLKDVFGLQVGAMPEHYLEKLHTLMKAGDTAQWPSMLVAVATLWLMWFWPKWQPKIPAHLPAILFGSVLALVLAKFGYVVDTIGSRFQFTNAQGELMFGIPDMLPGLSWPWDLPGADGKPLVFSSELVKDLFTAAFAMAMLGAIESLLCAVVLDGMTSKRHSANSELLGQGIGNIVAPFFGGITATAALARSAANVRAGAVSPVSGMVHALVVLAALLLLAPLLSYVPMAVMAALLLVVAWNMSEAPKALHLINTAPKSDVWVFTLCFSLTVLFDMVIAISCGVMIAALFFVRDVAAMTRLQDISQQQKWGIGDLQPEQRVFRISGPLFFAAADRIFAELLHQTKEQAQLVVLMDAVSVLDAGGLSALEKFLSHCEKHNKQLYLAELQFQPLKTLAKAQIKPVDGLLSYHSNLHDALQLMRQHEVERLGVRQEPTLDLAGL